MSEDEWFLVKYRLGVFFKPNTTHYFLNLPS